MLPAALRAALLLVLLAALPGCPPSQPSQRARFALTLAPQPAPARHLVAALP